VEKWAISPPIGRPIANTRIYLLDEALEPVPLGAVGEIYIGGAGVARGYLNRPELTAERFIASPFVQGDRLYRTGDLARYLADGDIEFLGRNDQQVKIRGFRIEPGEIEAKLLEHPGVAQAAVIAREDGAGDKRLVAYYVAQDQEASAEALRGHLSKVLPEHMVPAAYVRLQALPLTPNGKLDRKALPEPDEEAFSRAAYEPPQGPVEEALAAIWAELLGLERIGRHDNFFELGGHSLMAVRVMSRLQAEFGVGVPLGSFFVTPTLTSLSDIVLALKILQEDGQAPSFVEVER
jgi:acyl carrier protein